MTQQKIQENALPEIHQSQEEEDDYELDEDHTNDEPRDLSD